MAFVIFDCGCGSTTPVLTNTCRIGTTPAVTDFYSDFGSILGGCQGTLCLQSEFSTIIMGDNNCIVPIVPPTVSLGSFNTIVNGNDNTICGNYNTIFGGHNNVIDGGLDESAIVGGSYHHIGADCAFIGGGYKHDISSGIGAFIGGGSGNNISNDYSVVFGGINNQIATLSNFIGGGESNVIVGDCNAISGGSDNAICVGSNFGYIGGGSANVIDDFSDYGSIGGGVGNILQTTTSTGFIGGGDANCIGSNMGKAVVVGGIDNLSAGNASSVIGGSGNRICVNADCSFIGGGSANTINAAGSASVIGGGGSNTITGICSVISGGISNFISGTASFIGGGELNAACFNSDCSVIVGGQKNKVFRDAPFSFIGGGVCNCISFAAHTGATLVCNNVLMGGSCNFVRCGQDNVIAGGWNNRNTTPNNCNSILGGANNWICKGDYIGIYGSNITSISPRFFHTENIVVNNMPVGSAPALGQLYYLIASGVSCEVYINL